MILNTGRVKIFIFDEELLEEISDLAKESERSFNQMARYLMREGLKHYKNG